MMTDLAGEPPKGGAIKVSMVERRGSNNRKMRLKSERGVAKVKRIERRGTDYRMTVSSAPPADDDGSRMRPPEGGRYQGLR